MLELRQDIPALAMPLNILLLLWMIGGRALFIPSGLLVLLCVFVSPLLVICLVVTTRLMRRPPGRVLTSGQAWAQIVLWVSMFGFGFTCLDGGGDGISRSVLTKIAGGGPVVTTVSDLTCTASVVVGVVAWFVLHSKLSASPAHQPHPGPGDPSGQAGPGPSH